MEIEQIARLTHEVNRAYCASMGDTNHVPWEEADEWQKGSARQGVRVVIDNPDVTPEQMHINWMNVKVADGWVHGEVKDAEKKTHPCIQPYDFLPQSQRIKDHLFSAVVKACL